MQLNLVHFLPRVFHLRQFRWPIYITELLTYLITPPYDNRQESRIKDILVYVDGRASGFKGKRSELDS